MDLAGIAPWAVLIAALFFFLWLDLHFFARARAELQGGGLVVGGVARAQPAAALAVGAYEGHDAVPYRPST